MDLWTEFEGVTIDKSFALSKLLQTEGRSAFFSTRNANGEPVLMRIIECHFDEEEILARWRGVQTLNHPSFLRIEHFGQFLIEADDITAVYAVFERVDANLGDVLEQGKLSIPEAAQIGLSIVSALETLHANGFVHEHVEARTIYAVGETVKLRSDCIRETPEGEAAVAARRRDVHDLAVVIMQVLLGNPRAVQMPRSGTLIARFEELVRKGMSGEWGLAEIKLALAPYKPVTPVQKAPAPKPATAAPAASTSAAPQTISAKIQPEAKPKDAPVVAAAAAASKPVTAAKPAPAASTVTPARVGPKSEPWGEAARARTSGSNERKPFPAAERPVVDVSNWLSVLQNDRRIWAAAAVLLLVIALGWMFARRSSGHPVTAAATNQPSASDSASRAASAPQHTQAAVARSATAAAPGGKQQWRVVAFTYNREDQARKKASSVAQKNPELHAEAFSPTGRAPWLVTVGGAMERDDAYALARKARSLGLPRDSYAQNYTIR